MSPIQPIETRYKDCRFRSRLEARWAVFFDAMGITWQYEPQGYELDLGDWYSNPPTGVTFRGVRRYLPDFWLPQVDMFAEVKPRWPSANELALAGALADFSGHQVLVLDGMPDGRTHWGIDGMEFEHGGWDLSLIEYDLTEPHRYWLDERRFYSGDQCYLTVDWRGHPGSGEADQQCHGVRAALSARFEHGECG